MSRSGSKVSMTQFTEKFFIHSLKYDYQMASDEMKFLILSKYNYNRRKMCCAMKHKKETKSILQAEKLHRKPTYEVLQITSMDIDPLKYI